MQAPAYPSPRDGERAGAIVGPRDRVLQELLGHATVAVTLDTYSHVIPSMGDQTARAMQNALSPMEDALT
jgi:integrase